MKQEPTKPTPSQMWTYLIMKNIQMSLVTNGTRQDKILKKDVLNNRVILYDQVQLALNRAGSIKNLMIKKYLEKLKKEIELCDIGIRNDKAALKEARWYERKFKRDMKASITMNETLKEAFKRSIEIIDLTEPDKHESGGLDKKVA